MSDLVVITFASESDAAAARKVVGQLERAGQLQISDAAVVTRDTEGKLHVKNEIDSGIKIGALGGALVGVLLSFLFPLAGLIIGTAGGALVGRSLDKGVDGSFVKDLANELEAGSSALFLIVGGDAAALRAALGSFAGELYHSTLDPDLENELRNALQ
ncbi:DUF1269 domain-containing protein [Candidatus Gracilibacteria bacterium]|nr:DUF1269 domain-containing protein [Candidatus Gracilibacteria bacterium]